MYPEAEVVGHGAARFVLCVQVRFIIQEFSFFCATLSFWQVSELARRRLSFFLLIAEHGAARR